MLQIERERDLKDMHCNTQNPELNIDLRISLFESEESKTIIFLDSYSDSARNSPD